MAIPFSQPPMEDVSSRWVAWQRWYQHLWNYFERRVSGGNNTDNGTGFRGPFGWTSSRSGLGAYVINHNIGHTDYGIAFSCSAVGVVAVEVIATASQVTFKTKTGAGALTDTAWLFVMSEA